MAEFETVLPDKYAQEDRNEGKTFKQVLLFSKIKKAVQTHTSARSFSELRCAMYGF
jgi:hypothetical protein